MTINFNSLIEKYILGQLKGNDLDNFLQQIEDSKELANKVKFEQDLYNAIQENKIMALRSNLQTIMSDLEKENQQTVSENLWKEITYSLQEKEVHDLRNNLSQIISTSGASTTNYPIDEIIDNEIEEAISETDVHNLRASLNTIIEEEQKTASEEIAIIDKFLTDSNNSDHAKLEKQLINNKRLKKELKLNAEINEAISENDIMQLRANLTDIGNEEKEKPNIRHLVPNKTKRSPIRYVGAAASAAVIITAGTLTLSKNKLDSHELYNKAYKPYEAAGVFRSASEISPEIAGIDLYNRQKYNGALEQFNLALKDNPEHPMCNFYSGLSHQELGKYNKAISFYKKVIAEHDNLFIEQAEWYMALCYLQTEDTTKANKIFKQIIEKNGYYSKDAKAILKRAY